MIFLDTSFLLALAMPNDSLHAAARQWTLQSRGPFLTTEYVLLEFVNALSTLANRARAHVFLVSLGATGATRIVPASPSLFADGLRLHARRPDKEWSLTDCTSFVVMEREGCTEALTHDHHFVQAGFTALLASPPSTQS